MRTPVLVLLLGLAVWSWAAPTDGGPLYRWTDANGTVHYSDRRPEGPGIVAEPVPGTEHASESETAPAPPPAIEPQRTALLDNVGSVTGVPSDVLAAVASLARQRHPGNEAAQALFVRQQLDAYRLLQQYSAPDIPNDALLEMFRRARVEHPTDYAGQKYSVDTQIAAWRQQAAGGASNPYGQPAQSGGSTTITETTTVLSDYPYYYPGYPGYHHPVPAPQQPYIIYHPGPNAPSVGPQEKPVILMPPGWKPLNETGSAPPPPKPAPRPRPAKASSRGAGGSAASQP
jgi:hypothetical protein